MKVNQDELMVIPLASCCEHEIMRTQLLILYTWDELILQTSSVGRPLHENFPKPNSESSFAEYVLSEFGLKKFS